MDADEAVASAKAGIGRRDFEQIVEKVPAPTQMLKPSPIFDSVYDAYRGAILQVRVATEWLNQARRSSLASNGKTFDVTEVGIFTPKAVGRDFATETSAMLRLSAKTTGYRASGIR